MKGLVAQPVWVWEAGKLAHPSRPLHPLLQRAARPADAGSADAAAIASPLGADKLHQLRPAGSPQTGTPLQGM